MFISMFPRGLHKITAESRLRSHRKCCQWFRISHTGRRCPLFALYSVYPR